MATWAINEQQTLYLGGATGGTFTLGNGTTNTAALAHDASAATIETALEGIYGAGNVTVTADTDFLIEFVMSVGESDLEANLASLTGATDPTLTLTRAYASLTFEIRWGTYYPPHAESGFASIRVLPPDLGTDSVEVVQQSGRDKKVITFTGQCWSIADYSAIMDAHFTADVRYFSGPDVTDFPCFIRQLSAPEYVIDYLSNGYYRYNIILCEDVVE